MKPNGFFPSGGDGDGYGFSFKFTFTADSQFFNSDCNTYCQDARKQLLQYTKTGVEEATGMVNLFDGRDTAIELDYNKVGRRRAITMQATVTYRTQSRPLVIEAYTAMQQNGAYGKVIKKVKEANGAFNLEMSDVTMVSDSLAFVDYKGTFAPTQKKEDNSLDRTFKPTLDRTSPPTKTGQANQPTPKPTKSPLKNGATYSPVKSTSLPTPSPSPPPVATGASAGGADDSLGLIVLIIVIVLVLIAGVAIIVILYKRRSGGNVVAKGGRTQTYENPTYATGNPNAPQNQAGTVQSQNGRKVLILDPYGDSKPQEAPRPLSTQRDENDC